MTRYNTANLIALFAAPLILAACGGSSGGPGGPGGTSFLGFPIPDSSTATISGISKSANFTFDSTGNTTSMTPVADGTVTADVTVDADGDVSSLTLKSGSTTNTWDQNNSVTAKGNGFITAATDDGLKSVIVAAPEDNGFTYQTYGAWETSNASMTSGTVGVFSAGTQTAAAAVPTSGTATFKGTAGGLYSDGAGNSDVVGGDATLNVDFAAKSVALSTIGTESLATGAPRADLNMTGTLSYAGGDMTGTFSTAGGAPGGSVTGTVEGRFYGPAAEEIGGVFAGTGTAPGSTAVFGGGFGAVKQ